MESKYCALGVLLSLDDSTRTRVEYVVQCRSDGVYWINAIHGQSFRDLKAAKATRKIYRESRPYLKKSDLRIVKRTITETTV